MPPARIAVIGAGAIGLTSACRLIEAGFDVTILARDVTPETTSDIAAAFWSPSPLQIGERERGWAITGYQVFAGLAENPETGVDMLDLYDLYANPAKIPDFEPVASARPVQAGEFAAPWTGYVVPVPRIDTPSYMPWLYRHVVEMGAAVVRQELHSLSEVPNDFEVVVNCTGLGAARLTHDYVVFPIRGQVMRVRPPHDLPPRIIYAESDGAVTYIVPRRNDCLLGGTYQYHDGTTNVDDAIAAGIMDRCAAFYPELRDAEVLQHRVGLRPGRPSVRLEAGRLPDGRLAVHNYGHGPAGHTLSWGCAADVVRLIGESL